MGFILSHPALTTLRQSISLLAHGKWRVKSSTRTEKAGLMQVIQWPQGTMASGEHQAELELFCLSLPKASAPWHKANMKHEADVDLSLRHMERLHWSSL